jgi:hypothetical protein
VRLFPTPARRGPHLLFSTSPSSFSHADMSLLSGLCPRPTRRPSRPMQTPVCSMSALILRRVVLRLPHGVWAGSTTETWHCMLLDGRVFCANPLSFYWDRLRYPTPHFVTVLTTSQTRTLARGQVSQTHGHRGAGRVHAPSAYTVGGMSRTKRVVCHSSAARKTC